MSSSQDAHQVDIFSTNQQQRHFAELCNALYERELMSLAHSHANNVSLLQRRLGGLTHHIKRAAEQLLSQTAPIEVDIHNGSWQSKQAGKCVAHKIEQSKSEQWFERYAKVGLVVPVYVMDTAIEHIELDCIDRIDQEQQRLHTNKMGWFEFNGESVTQQSNPLYKSRLLYPNKSNMSAACCGHSWNHKGKTQPRALTLRELLLSTTINWKTFR